MTRKLHDWLTAYTNYTKGTEAPRLLHFFAGVSAIAGALRRKVWIDQVRFKWYANLYIVFVADPGIVSKSTTADLAMDLLREVPGIKFGPDSVTWQSLVTSFAGACESFEYNDEYYPMSPITLLASEFGSLMNLADQEMVNLFITLWDGRSRYEKETKMSGNDIVEAPWINMLACTTPSWLSTNMTKLSMAGGLTSRILYIFADGKERLVAYPFETAPAEVEQAKADLIADLEHISVNLCGPVTLTARGREWGHEWYKDLWTNVYKQEAEDWFKGYIARKQTQMHKLAMIISISRGDSLLITDEDLQLADVMLKQCEVDYNKVFQNVGKSEAYIHTTKFLELLKSKGSVPYAEVHRLMHSAFPDARDMNGIIQGITQSAYVRLDTRADGFWMTYVGP